MWYIIVSIEIHFRMPATEEQLLICQSQGQVVKIKAGAGTGKTTTLRGLAQRNPQSKILYLAFNRAIKDEATAKFTPNVKAMTAHGLAFSRIGKDYANVPDKLASGDIKPFHVQGAIGSTLKKMPQNLQNLYGGRVIEAVKSFLISPAEELGPEHVTMPSAPAEKKHFVASRLLSDAQKVWEEMQKLDSKVPMIHDGYLKMFQLQAPKLWYDMILLDEAQDTNPVTQALVEQQAARRIYVGDEHQAIYAFRGARNAMNAVEADEEFFLTGSFRFGQQIADLANLLLDAKGEEELRLRGLGRPSLVAPLADKTPHAFIARGNSALFARAIEAMENNESFAFVGPLFNYRFDLIEQAYNLSIGGKVKDPFLASFKNFEELEEYAEAMEDRENMGRCKIVTRYSRRIPFLVSQIQSKAGMHGSGTAHQVTLTSAHRAKGLEFDNVIMADDFMDFFDDESGEWKDMTRADAYEAEEVNLQYVAATRAKKQLQIGEKLENFVAHQQVVIAAKNKKRQGAAPVVPVSC